MFLKFRKVLEITCAVGFLFKEASANRFYSRAALNGFLENFKLDLQVYLKRIPSRTFNPFLANIPILYPLNTPENLGFLVFASDKKWELWPEMG